MKDDPAIINALKRIDALSERDIFLAQELGDGHILGLDLIGKDVSEVLPHIGGLKRLESLEIDVSAFSVEETTPLGELKSLRVLTVCCNDAQLQAISNLTNVEELRCSKNGITNDSLKYLAKMKKMAKLFLEGNPISGEGLQYLEGFTELRELHLTQTDFNDNAIPYVVSNFPNLRLIDLGDTKVTADGLLQLAELHFLIGVGLPNDLFGILPMGLSSEERRDTVRQQQLAKRQFMIEYLKRYVASKEQAKTAGEKVPPDDYHPFAGTVSLSDLDTRRKQ